MSVDVTVAATIRRPADDVAAYAADPSNAPTWYRRIQSAEWVGDPVVAVGSRCAFRARFVGRELVYTYEILEFVAGERLVMSTAEGQFPMTTEYRWESVPGGTLMTIRNHGEPEGFGRFVVPVMAMAMRRAMSGDLAALTKLLESDD